MAGPKTHGYALSALPSAPSIPANVGKVDVREIYDGVRRGLLNAELVRTAPQNMALADERNATDVAQQRAIRERLPAQTQGILADTPNRSTILAEQARVAQGTTPAILAEQGVKKTAADAVAGAQAQASDQLAEFTDAYADAQSLASYGSKAAALEALSVKYPWIDTAPEFRGVAAKIKEAAVAARVAAQNDERMEAAQNVAQLKATKPLTGTPYLLNRMDELRKAAAEHPEDESILRAIDDTQAALNAISAQSQKDPTADRQSRERVSEQQGAAKIQAAKEKFNLQKQAGASKATAALQSAEAQTSRLDGLIDSALSDLGPTTTGIGAVTANIPGTTARRLRETISTIKANLGFNELAAMRASSPTGGALGNVTERELDFLQKTIASLDQYLDDDDLRKNLEQVRRDVKGSWQRIRDAYQRDFGSAPAGAAAGAGAQGGTAPARRAFATAAEAEAAASRGEIKSGEPITVGGVPGTWQ